MPTKIVIKDTPFQYYAETGVYLARTKDTKAIIHFEGGAWTCSMLVRLAGMDYISQGRSVDPEVAVSRARTASLRKYNRKART